MSTSLYALANSMCDLVKQVLHTINVQNLREAALKFSELPTQEVLPTLTFSELLGTIDTRSAGTVLNSGDGPVAVIFNIKQFEMVQSIMNYIPSVIEKLQISFDNRIKLNELGEKMITTIASPLQLGVVSLVVGSVAIIAGAFLLGSASKKNEDSYTKYIPGFACLIPGICALMFSTHLINVVAASAGTFAKIYKDL